MTTTVERVTESDLVAIGRRLSVNMNDDGLRAWYAHDVQRLLMEVVTLRQERAQAIALLQSNPPLAEDGTPSADLLPLIERLVSLWQEQEQGLWSKARYAVLREKAREEHERAEVQASQAQVLSDKIERLTEFNDSLRSQVMESSAQAGKERSAREHFVREAERERDEARAALAAKHSEAVGAIEATRKAYERKADSARELLDRALDVLR